MRVTILGTMLVNTVFEDYGLRIATSRNVVAAAWFDAPTLERLDQLAAAGRDVREQYPSGTALLNVMIRGRARFSREVIEKTAEVMRANKVDSHLASAHIIAVDGLPGVAARGFLRTVILMARPKRPLQVFEDITDCSDWFLDQLNVEGATRWTHLDLLELYRRVKRDPML